MGASPSYSAQPGAFRPARSGKGTEVEVVCAQPRRRQHLSSEWTLSSSSTPVARAAAPPDTVERARQAFEAIGAAVDSMADRADEIAAAVRKAAAGFNRLQRDIL